MKSIYFFLLLFVFSNKLIGQQDSLLASDIIEAGPKTASLLSIQTANPADLAKTESENSETGTSVWWYILPTSGFALLLSLYFIKRRKK